MRETGRNGITSKLRDTILRGRLLYRTLNMITTQGISYEPSAKDDRAYE
jgi:hypothetical protein